MDVHPEEYTKKTVSWDKWVNPYNKKIPKKLTNPSDTVAEEEEYFEDTTKATNVLITPLGAIPINSAEDVFNFWLGSTNFNISSDIVNIIKKTDGVEVFQLFTRYRFRIGVGKLFLPDATMKRVEKRITAYFDKRAADDRGNGE